MSHRLHRRAHPRAPVRREHQLVLPLTVYPELAPPALPTDNCLPRGLVAGAPRDAARPAPGGAAQLEIGGVP